jgi:hypothetical protein
MPDCTGVLDCTIEQVVEELVSTESTERNATLYKAMILVA